MAKCPECGEIWHCNNEEDEFYYEEGEEFQHCRTCRCRECRMMADKPKWGEYLV